MLPVLALVGRPNVGKSTLFNQLTRSRDALVADLSGLTRDRQYGQGRIDETAFIVIDTGGITGEEEGIDAAMANQSMAAIEEADVVLLLVDGREGLHPGDEALVGYLRSQGKPFHLVVNKIDGVGEDIASSDFFRLGVDQLHPIAASHNRGVKKLIAAVLAPWSEAGEPETDAETNGAIRVAIVGRPNVGKSTLVNRLLGEERVVVFDQPGTTRDSVYIDYERRGRHYTLIDTAGVRKRKNVKEAVEKFSIVKTLKAIADAQVVFDWVIANADTYNLDPNHIVIGGRSRGSIISWQLAHSNHPSIKGIYMYNALPQSAWQNIDTWNPADEITIDSPITYLVYGPDFDDDDGHNPVNVDPVLARYDELAIGDKITRYVNMWGDFRNANGGWNNDAHTMHYFAEFAEKVEETDLPPTLSHNTLFMGHSFFAPIARQMPFHMSQLGIDDHSQHVEMSGGETGTPIALWEDEEHRNTIQAVLDTGEVELFGMTASPTIEGYTLWIDYALSKNPNTKIVIGTPWLDFPADYSDATHYENTIIDGLNEVILVDIDELRVRYPNTEIINLPYAFAAIELRHMFEAGQLSGITELIGSNSNTSIFSDEKGHGHGNGLLLDLAEFIWLTHIYGIDLDHSH